MQTLFLYVKYFGFGGKGGLLGLVPKLAKTRNEIKSRDKNNTQEKKKRDPN